MNNEEKKRRYNILKSKREWYLRNRLEVRKKQNARYHYLMGLLRKAIEGGWNETRKPD